MPDYTDLAYKECLARLYRAYGSVPQGATLPPMYDHLVEVLAKRKELREGAEGEIAHNENGVNRTYGSVNDEDILSQIVPFAKVF